MKIIFGFILIQIALLLAAYEHFHMGELFTPPAARAAKKWKTEVEKNVSKSKTLQVSLPSLYKIEQTTTDQQFKEMIDATTSPFKVVAGGNYLLKLQFMPWMEDMKYGYLIQHEVFDVTGNKVSEFNVNIEIGRLW